LTVIEATLRSMAVEAAEGSSSESVVRSLDMRVVGTHRHKVLTFTLAGDEGTIDLFDHLVVLSTGTCLLDSLIDRVANRD